MRTPALHGRVVAAGMSTVALMLGVVATSVYFGVQARLEANLSEMLHARAAIVREMDPLQTPQLIVAEIEANGIVATITTATGEVHETAPRSVMIDVSGFEPDVVVNHHNRDLSEIVEFDDGTAVEIYATRSGIDFTMRQLLGSMIVGSLVALMATLLLLRRVSRFVVAPLDEVAAAARRTWEGRLGERLDPDDPSTSLGQMAVAYDEMLDRLEQALDAARDAEARTRQFVDDAAHQLRTPLAGERATLEAMLHEQDPDVRDRLMSNLLHEFARAERLVRDMVTLARVNAESPVERVPTDVHRVCHEEAERFWSLAPDLVIDCRLDPRVNGLWMLDEEAIREVIANLVDNARRHAKRTIVLESQLGDGVDGRAEVEIRVIDDGPGIPDHSEDLIFERFASLDGEHGSGLGLPICRGLTRAHGGDVTYHDGSFVVRLPAVAADRQPEAAA